MSPPEVIESQFSLRIFCPRMALVAQRRSLKVFDVGWIASALPERSRTCFFGGESPHFFVVGGRPEPRRRGT